MPKIELIYSQQASDFQTGKAYSNPRFFTTPRSDVSKVYLVGDWPKIRQAYEALNVPVEQINAEAAEAPVSRAAPAALTPALPAEERAEVFIPEDWRELNYNRPKPGRDLTLRGIAAMLSDEPVINREKAVNAIEAELARRGAVSTKPDADEVGPNGLTRREMNADLAAADIEVNPSLSIEDLAKLHGELKAKS